MTFYDSGLVRDGEASLAAGVVNGTPIFCKSGHVYVPVWCERDKGREPTTIVVHTSNIVGVEPPTTSPFE